MVSARSSLVCGLLLAINTLAQAADIIVSAQDGKFVRGEAAQGVVFSQDGRQLLLQMDVERALGVYVIKDGKLVDTGTRIALAAGPVSIRSMPR